MPPCFWAVLSNPREGFDYLSSYKKYVTYGAQGFYPANPLRASVDVLLTKGDLPTPTWYNEFVTGGPGNYGSKGTVRSMSPSPRSCPRLRRLCAACIPRSTYRGPETPSGVYARVVEGRTLYVNTTESEKAIAIQGKKHGILSGQTYDTVLRLKPHDADLLE